MFKAPHFKRPLLATLLAVGLCLLQAPDALAYFDPASGGLMLQMILGGIAGVALIVRIYWHKLLGLFGVKTADPRAEEYEDEDDIEDEADDDDR